MKAESKNSQAILVIGRFLQSKASYMAKSNKRIFQQSGYIPFAPFHMRDKLFSLVGPGERHFKFLEDQAALSYPSVFITGELPTDYPADVYKAALTANALAGWGACMAGIPMPEKFGWGMMMIGTVLGITMTPDGVSEYAKQFLPQS